MDTENKKRISVVVTNPYLEAIECLVRDGFYVNRAEIIKDALRRLFVQYEISLITDEAAECLTTEDELNL
ncbi:MAG: hypothetical protein D4S01_09120 [Dehalococcoidia bacterium]|nr:MAG: hypothetical protein D4S01_09120 [Dehalococcoidia bacterium]